MAGSLININLDGLSAPGVKLIEKVSEAVGGMARPYQIRRVAEAEADAEIIRAQANIQVSEIQRRALDRWLQEEGQKQENIEKITEQAIPHLEKEAKPESIEKDWMTYFFDKCRLVSDEEMQSLWAKVLAGQANAPGSFSKKTIGIVETLDKKDAALFTSLCAFAWMIGDVTPLVYEINKEPYIASGINFVNLSHLDDIGLISFNSIAGFQRGGLTKYLHAFYYGAPIAIEFQKDRDNKFNAGHVLMTRAGQELAKICGSKPSDDFFMYVLNKWYREGLIMSCPISSRQNMK